jgi:hypothetical protein
MRVECNAHRQPNRYVYRQTETDMQQQQEGRNCKRNMGVTYKVRPF